MTNTTKCINLATFIQEKRYIKSNFKPVSVGSSLSFVVSCFVSWPEQQVDPSLSFPEKSTSCLHEEPSQPTWFPPRLEEPSLQLKEIHENVWLPWLLSWWDLHTIFGCFQLQEDLELQVVWQLLHIECRTSLRRQEPILCDVQSSRYQPTREPWSCQP